MLAQINDYQIDYQMKPLGFLRNGVTVTPDNLIIMSSSIRVAVTHLVYTQATVATLLRTTTVCNRRCVPIWREVYT